MTFRAMVFVVSARTGLTSLLEAPQPRPQACRRAYLAACALIAATGLTIATPDVPAAASSVSSVSATLSTTAVTAIGVQYTVTLTTPSALSAGGSFGAGASTITLMGPAGTVFAGGVPNYAIKDVTAGGNLVGLCGACANPSPVVTGSASVTIALPINIAAGHVVEVVAYGVTNGSGAGGSLAVSTSADTMPVSVALGLVAASMPGAVSVAPSSTAEGAPGVQYTVTFTTSASGALNPGNTGNFGAGASTITLMGPAGTVFPSNVAGYALKDLTAAGSLVGLCGACANPTPVVAGGTTATIAVPIDIPSGHVVEVIAYGVTNGAGAGGTLTLSTSSDTTAVTQGLGLVPMQAISDAFTTVSNSAPGAAGVEYVVTFTSSSSGGLSGGNPINFGFGASTVTITAPAGTMFPTATADYSVADLTQVGSPIGLCGSCAHPSPLVLGTSAVTIAVPDGVVADNITAGGDQIQVVITGVTNPSSLAAPTVSTSSDGAQPAPITTTTTTSITTTSTTRLTTTTTSSTTTTTTTTHPTTTTTPTTTTSTTTSSSTTTTTTHTTTSTTTTSSTSTTMASTTTTRPPPTTTSMASTTTTRPSTTTTSTTSSTTTTRPATTTSTTSTTTTTLLTVLPPTACADAQAAAAIETAIAAQCDCVGAANHGAFVRCATRLAKAAVKAGTLPKPCKGAVKHCAAQSICGKPGFVTCCRTTAKGKTNCHIKSSATHCKPPTHGRACVGSRPSCCDACVAGGCAEATAARLEVP